MSDNTFHSDPTRATDSLSVSESVSEWHGVLLAFTHDILRQRTCKYDDIH